MGPVQVLVVGFDQPTFSGEVLAELTRLREAGIVRLVDLLLVSRAEDGTLEMIISPDGPGADLGGLAAAVLGNPEGEPDAASVADADSNDLSTWSLADAVPPGSAAAVAPHRAHLGRTSNCGDPASRWQPARGDLAGTRRPRTARGPDRPTQSLRDAPVQVGPCMAVASFRPDIAQTRLLRYRYGHHRHGRLATAATRLLANTSEPALTIDKSPRS